jgi:folate-binding protein YgfZ
MADARFSLLDDRGVLSVGGSDRRSFLQALVSNDVDKLAPGRARHAALLTAQGRYLHDFMMIEADATIWLETELGRLGDLRRRLSIYRLRADVVIEERADLAVAAVFGDAVFAALDLAEPGVARPFAGGVLFADPRLAALGARCIASRMAVRAGLVAAGLGEADFAAYDRLRLGLGVPDGSRDLIPEKSILLEAGFDELNGIDWNKGCYIGQELTARTKYRGLVKRRLMPVAIEGPLPALGAKVTLAGREVGEMRSGRPGLGLALLRTEAAIEGARLGAGNAVIVPQRPGWMRFPTEPGEA